MPFDLAALESRFPARAIHWFPSLPSTMTEAARLAAAGCPSGTLVGADEQTAGVGRHGHSWHSERETGLYVSIVLRLPVKAADLPPVTLALGLAAASAITEVSGVATDLRWPNDVLLPEKKCAGILVQLQEKAIVAGIGINVNQPEFPPDLTPIATSLRIQSGRMQSREQLLIALLDAIDTNCDLLCDDGKEAILRMFSHASSYVAGRRVIVDLDGKAVTGITAGLNPDGFLKLRGDDGSDHLILAGGVRPAL